MLQIYLVIVGCCFCLFVSVFVCCCCFEGEVVLFSYLLFYFIVFNCF